MALTATIFKAVIQVADMDRGYYGTHNLTIARHPSETDARMMARLLAFALQASERLEFTKGLCADDEPEIWAKSLSGDIELWIEVGLPDQRRIRKACNRAAHVVVYAYGGHQAQLWWERTRADLVRFSNLEVFELPVEATSAIAELATRTMQLQCTVQEGQVWFGTQEATELIEPVRWR